METNTEQNKKVNPKYVTGIKGWLLIFLLSLIYIGVYLTAAVMEQILSPRQHFFNLRAEFQMVSIALFVAGAFFPFFVAFQLYKKKTQSLLLAKVFLVLLPFYAFTWTIFKFKVIPFDVESAIISGFFMCGVLYSIPWLVYLNFSKRVKNTYLFTNNILPKNVQCPYCLDILELENDEQLVKEFFCLNCNNNVSAKSIVV